MTETEFLEAAEKLFERVENIIDEDGLDVDSDRAGNVLTLEADNGEQVVINLHAPTPASVACKPPGRPAFYAGGRHLAEHAG